MLGRGTKVKSAGEEPTGVASYRSIPSLVLGRSWCCHDYTPTKPVPVSLDFCWYLLMLKPQYLMILKLFFYVAGLASVWLDGNGVPTRGSIAVGETQERDWQHRRASSVG